MTAITLNLSVDLYQRLRAESHRRGVSPEALVEDLLAERLPTTTVSDRDRVTEVLRAAGLLTELGAEEKERAARSIATLEEIQALLAKGSGLGLSEIVIEQRGPRV